MPLSSSWRICISRCSPSNTCTRGRSTWPSGNSVCIFHLLSRHWNQPVLDLSSSMTVPVPRSSSMKWQSSEAQRHSDTAGRVDWLSSLLRLHVAWPADTLSFIPDCRMLHAESRLCHKDDAVIRRSEEGVPFSYPFCGNIQLSLTSASLRGGIAGVSVNLHRVHRQDLRRQDDRDNVPCSDTGDCLLARRWHNRLLPADIL